MNIFRKKNVLVTGGAGFIGSWLTKELLGREAKVIVIDLKKNLPIAEDFSKTPVLIQGDVRRFALIKKIIQKYNIDLIFHLAAQTLVGIANQDPLPTLKTNILGTWNVLEAARKYRVEGVVVASSDKAYGQSVDIPYTEDAPLKGLHPYDASKSSADLLSQMYFKTYKLPLCIIRSGNVFGGGDLHFSRLIPDTVRSAFYNQRPVIRSNGRYLRDYIYIKDAVAGYLAAADKLDGQAFNLGTKKPQPALKVVHTVLRLMGKSHLRPRILNQAQNEIQNQSLDFSKAKKELSWRPRYSLEAGLKETIPWYIQYFKERKR